MRANSLISFPFYVLVDFAGEWGFVTYQIYISVGKYEIQPRRKKENLSSYDREI
jgi:hypothetical protein